MSRRKAEKERTPDAALRPPRKFDLLIFGATGYFGRLVSDYISQKVGGLKSWGLVGRNFSRLQALCWDLNKEDIHINVLNFETASDEEIKTITSQTQVVLNCLAADLDFKRLIRACVATSTSYVDPVYSSDRLSSIFNDTSLASAAEKAKCLIMPGLRAESVLTDVGVWYAKEQLQPGQLETVEVYKKVKETSYRPLLRDAWKLVSNLSDPVTTISSSTTMWEILQSRQYEERLGRWTISVPSGASSVVTKHTTANLHDPNEKFRLAAKAAFPTLGNLLLFLFILFLLWLLFSFVLPKKLRQGLILDRAGERGFVPNKQAQNDPSMDYRAQVALRNNFDPISQALVDERPRSAVSVALVASGSLSPYIATSSHEQMRKQLFLRIRSPAGVSAVRVSVICLVQVALLISNTFGHGEDLGKRVGGVTTPASVFQEQLFAVLRRDGSIRFITGRSQSRPWSLW